jgi:hypothetical protein
MLIGRGAVPPSQTLPLSPQTAASRNQPHNTQTGAERRSTGGGEVDSAGNNHDEASLQKQTDSAAKDYFQKIKSLELIVYVEGVNVL